MLKYYQNHQTQSNILFGIKSHSEIVFVRHLFSHFTLKVFTVYEKSKQSRPPSLLDSAAHLFFCLYVLFLQIKSKNISLNSFIALSLTTNERAEYTKWESPSTLDKRSLWSQMLKICFIFFLIILSETFKLCLLTEFLVIWLPQN